MHEMKRKRISFHIKTETGLRTLLRTDCYCIVTSSLSRSSQSSVPLCSSSIHLATYYIRALLVET